MARNEEINSVHIGTTKEGAFSYHLQ